MARFPGILMLGAMGYTNLKHSLTKRFAGLTGELESTHSQIERIKREQETLPELEARVIELKG